MKLLISCLVVAGLSLLPGEVRAQQYLATADAPKPQAIPFQLEGGFLIQVEGGIGPLEGLKLILDTGTTYSVIDRRIANRFSAKRRPGRVFNYDGFASVEWAEFPDVHFGPINVHNVSMMVTQLAQYSELIGSADAVIGLDLLSMAGKLGVFYDSRTVVLTPRDGNTHGSSQGERPEHIAVQAMVEGHPIRLLLDTGLDGIVLYEDRIRKWAPNLRFTHQRKDAHMGRLQGKTVRLPNFRLGRSDFDAEVFLMNGPKDDLLAGVDGYLGTGVLKAKRIEVDLEGKTVRWQ